MATIQENHEVMNCADIKPASIGCPRLSVSEDQGGCEYGSSEQSTEFDLKMQPVVYYTDTMDTEALSSGLDEHMQVSSELMDQLNVSSELAHDLDVSSELVHMQTISTDPVYSQPVNSDLVQSEPVGSEFDNSHDMANLQLVATDIVDSDAQPNKPKRKRSAVWDHFELETVSEGCTRAFCKACRQSYAYKTGSKVVGTSHLMRHIASEGCRRACAVMLRQQETIQPASYPPKRAKAKPRRPSTTDPPKQQSKSGFDQERCRHEIARMVIMHEYPLNMVEHPGFIAFVRNLQPRFDMVDFSALQGDCVDTYLRGKQNLQKIIDRMPGNISLALDMWTSSTRLTGYIFLYGQFIDHDWKLHRLLLNIVMEPFPESDTALSHAVATCLSYWNLQHNKLCSITLNQPLSEVGCENLRGLLSVKNPLILNGQLLVGRCIARALSDMARDALAAGQDTVSKVRSSVEYVKASDVDELKTLVLDNAMKWNTTYEMLHAACESKEVFSMDTAPTMEDWKRADFICAHLKLLQETANLTILAEAPPSTDVFFHEVRKIQRQLQSHAASDDPFVRNIVEVSQERFLEYWKAVYLVLAIAVAMDPRYKMKMVEFYFAKLFGEEAPTYIKVVDEGIHDLFREYSGNAGAKEGESLVSSNGYSEFEIYIMETSSHGAKSELDQYLEESVLPLQDLDVLGWWKLNELKYPALSKMARDILSIPLSSVGPDCMFDTVGREMDEYRSSLRSETVEALMCAKSWMQLGQLE